MEDRKLDKEQTLRSTLYIASEYGGDGRQLLQESLLQKNAMHQIGIRFQCNGQKPDVLQKALNGKELYGVTGRGDCTLILDYADFATIYPFYVTARLGQSAWNANPNFKPNKSLQDILKGYSPINECWHVKPGLPTNEQRTVEDKAVKEAKKRMPDNEHVWYQNRAVIYQAMHEAVGDLQKCIDKLLCDNEILDLLDKINFPEQRFKEQCRLIKDLLYTYDDLWYDKSTMPEGQFFYVQIAVLLMGIYQQIGMIKKAWEQQKEFVRQRPDTNQLRTFTTLKNDLISNMNIMISGINSFNKLIQAVNQNMRNVPNYEMQSKVNVEKYLYAYTMYLMDICRKYYLTPLEEEEEKQKERIFPMVTIAMSGQKISAYNLFRKLHDSEDTRAGVSVFLIQCPNYQRFANVYHVLPMISHEISHCFRYENRKERNTFVLCFLTRKIAEILTDRLFDEEYQRYRAHRWTKHVEFVYDIIYQELESDLRESLKKELPNIHLCNMEQLCIEKVRECLEVVEPHIFSENNLWEICRDDMLALFNHCRITYVVPADIEKEPNQYLFDALPNLLIDILRKDKDRVKEWNMVLSDDKIKIDSDKKVFLGELKDTISEYNNYQRISRETIDRCIEKFALRFWKNFITDDTEVEQLYCGNEDADAANERVREISARIAVDEEYEWQKLDVGIIGKVLGFDGETIFRLEQYILEIVDLVTEIRQQWNRYEEEYLYESLEYKSDCVKDIHRKLYKRYNEIIENLDTHRRIETKNDESQKYDWIITKKIHKLYTSLGIVSRNSEQFAARIRTAMRNIDRGYIKASLKDMMKLYQEVFADLGMCKMFGFTPFGYYAYTIHLFMKERERSQKDVYDMTGERMKIVFYILWDAKSGSNLEEPVNIKADAGKLDHELKDKIDEYEEKIICYEKEIKDRKKKGDREKESKEDSKEVIMHRHMLRWMKKLYDEMKFVPKDEYLLNYLKATYRNKMDFLEAARSPIMKEIGTYYNEFITTVGNEGKKKETMNIQNDFVLSYYGKMQDACARVETWDLNVKVHPEDFVEQYGSRFMQWQTEEKK
ncbi:MAG: hypothetical protein NC318_07905 [Blautia sp.]|nr:hypothetical protein [Blautia sp.]